jgi:hypothetical protein
MSYLGQSPGQGKAERFIFTASGGETSVTLDDAGRGIAYTPGQVDVYLNGVKLVNGTDFTATSGSSITGLSALSASDVVEIVALDAFSPADTVSAASGGSFGDAVTITDASNNPLTLNRTTSDGDIQVFQKDGTTVAFIANSGSAGEIVLNTNTGTGVGLYGSTSNGGSLLPTDETGSPSDNVKNLGRTDYRWKNLYLSGGVYLGGTGAANYLDDYEEGTWTASAASGSGVNVTTTYARYLKVGNLVQIEFKLWIGSTADSNTAVIGGLPFTANSASGNAAGSGLSWATAAGAYSAIALSSSTAFGIRRMDTASDPAWSAIDNGYIRGSFTYQI